MDHDAQIAELISNQKNVLLRMFIRITVYYAALGIAVALAATYVPGFSNYMPLGGLGEIAGYGGASAYELEEALVSADDEELVDIVTETTRARLESGPIWLRSAMTLLYAMASTLLLMLPVSWVYRAIHTGQRLRPFDRYDDAGSARRRSRHRNGRAAQPRAGVQPGRHRCRRALSKSIERHLRHAVHPVFDRRRHRRRRQVHRDRRCPDGVFQLCVDRSLRVRRRARVTARLAQRASSQKCQSGKSERKGRALDVQRSGF